MSFPSLSHNFGRPRFVFRFVLILIFLAGQNVWGNSLASAAPSERPSAASLPVVSLNVPAEEFIGNNVNFTVTFDNPDPTDPGYGPLIDLIIPRNGADGNQNTDTMDGLTFVSATYLGTNVESTILTFPGSGGVTCVDHPYMVNNTGNPVQVCGNAGDTFVALRLPFGSFTPDQPPVNVDVTVSMSNLADLGVPLTIQARGGYQFGYTPLNDWCCGDDPSLTLSAWTSASVTPILFTLQKTYNGPEDETATGPNFPRRYTVTATIAPGQTMTSFNLSDILPNNMQFVSLVSTNPAGASCALPSTTTPGGTLSCDFASVSGTVMMTFEYYIPLRDSGGGSVIDPTSGDDALSCNNASGGGTWVPIDTRDTGGTFTQNPTGCEHTLTDKSIAIQKSVSVVGGGDPAPGKYLEYTLDFQISDFFAFNNVVITDTISDGQHFAPGFTPTLQINGNTYTLSAAGFNAANYDVACHYTGAGAECESNTPPIDGTTTLIFRVSDEIITRGQDGRLVGGCVPTGGTGGGDPNCDVGSGGYNDGPTTGRIVFRTLIQENFTDTYPSGDPSVDQGDTLANTVSIEGLVLSTTDVSTVTDREADTSSASVTIGRGVLTKTIYAVNGSTSFGTPVEVKPGDTVTYRLTYTLTTGDVEDLAFNDYLPLPVFHVGDPDENGIAGPAWTFNPTVSAAAPPAGVAKFGPSDTFYVYSSIVPTVSSDTTNNRLDFLYGDFDGPTEQPYTVDILFTVTVSDDPFADRLYLTNQAHAFEGSTNAGTADANAIVQLILTEPVLTTTKSAVASDRPGAVFTPALPITFTAPGSAGPRWSGTINSNLLASTPINSDISGVDAGDLVTFAIFIENSGSSINGAFDIVIRDVFDALAFEYPTPGDPNSINLQIYYGSGTGPISYTKPDDTAATPADLFGGGIKLVDPVGQGVCQAHDPNSDNNVIVITYDLRLKSNIAPGTYTNTGSLTNYSGSEGGPNFLPAPQSEDATVTAVAPAIAKTLIYTEINDAFNSSSQAVIGEFATYTVTLTIPEGVTSNAQLVDTLDSGLAFVALDSVTLSPALSITGSTTPSVSSGGQVITFNFGDITNSDTDNTTPETIVLTYHVVALNILSNQAGTSLNNSAQFTWTGGSASASAPNVTVIEPVVNTAKSVLPATADAGDTVTFTVTLSNPASGSTIAYDVTWSDTVPTGLNYTAASLSGSCTTHVLTLSDAGAPTLTGSVSQLDPGETCTITFQATVDYSVTPGQTITNTAETRWTSMAGTVTDRSSYNTASDERDGADGLLNSGVLNDYRTQGQASVTIQNTTPQKYLFATSEAHTGDPGDGTQRVAIGEIVRYRLVVQLPEGTSPNFQIQDQLPTGLTYLDDGTARLALLSNGAPIASTEPTGSALALALGSGPFGSGPWVNGSDPTVVTPTYALPDQNVGSDNSLTADPDSYGSGTDPYFKLGTLTNNDSDADAEYVILEFNALVDNTSAGSNDTGDNRTNNFRVFINGVQNGNASNNITVRIAEPLLTLAKAVTTAPTDAGDSITYTLTISAASGADRATAFDLVLTDAFDSYLTGLSVTNVTTTQGATCTGNGGGTTSFSHNGGSFTGNTLTFTATCLDPGQSITITVSGTVAATAPAGYTIPNTANLTWTSLPGTGTSPNPTGSTTPGGSGAGNGERDGSGGINDYTASGSANAPLAAPQIDKLNPVPTQYAIGQQVTFNILITLPEGLTPALNVADNLPLGLRYVSHQVITTAAASGGLLAADYNGTFTNSPPIFTCSGTCAGGDDITLDFGDTTTAADNVTNNNAFLVQVVAVVLNESGNQNGTVLTNTATVSWTGGSASDSVDVTVIEPELDIAKAVDDTTPAYGQTLTYTLTVSHLPTSTATAYDIVVTDTIPSGLTYVPGSISAPAGWTTDDTAAPTLTWTCSAPCSLPVGSTASLTYQATVVSAPPPLPGATFTNTVSMTWTSTDGANPEERNGSGTPAYNDYSDSTSQTVTLTYPDLTITKTDGQTSYVPGSPVVYTIVVSNVGNGDALGATVSDTIPPQITSWTWACSGSTGGASGCDPYSGSGNFTDIVDLPAGSSITYTVTAQTDPAATTDLINTVTVAPPAGFTDPTPADNTASDTDTANPQADLSVTKDDGVTQYIPGGTLTYTITVSNAGPSNAPGSVITDTIPAQFTSWTWACTGSTGGASGCDGYGPGNANFSDTIDLPAGSSITYTVTAQVASSATGDLTNTVSVTPPAGVTDPTPGNNTAGDTDVQNSQAAISVTKDDGVTEYVPGSTLTYFITVTNTGPSDALGVSVTDNIPPQITSWTWSCFSSAGGASGCTPYSGNGSFSDSIDLAGPFPSSITYQVVAQVASSASGDLTNTVTISHPADSTPGDNTASDTDTPSFQADLYVTKDDGSATYTPGVGVTYTVRIGNNGPSDVSGAVLTDNIPAQATSWTWTCSGSTGGATGCDGYGPGNANFSDTVDLPAGSSITYTVTLVIPSSATGDLVNTANIELPAGVTDTNSGNNIATDTDTQNSQAAISVTKDDGVTEYVPGGTLTYTITVTNTGPSDALGVSVSDPKPSQVVSWDWICAPSGGATCNGSGGPITTDFSDTIDLPAGSSVTYTVTAQIASSATGDLTNTVTVSHPADSTPGDNAASDTDTANPQADLSVTKDDGVTVVSPDSTITYTITVSNAGPSDALGATVSDSKPSQIDTWDWVCTAQTGGASGCDGVIGSTTDFTDTVNLPAGASITYTVTAHIAAGAGSGNLTNTVTVTPPSGVTDPDPGDNTDDDTDTIITTPTGDLTKSLIATNQSFTADPSVAIGEILTYEVVFTVPAGGTLPSLTLTDVLDRGLAFVDCLSVMPSSTDITTTLPGGFDAACNDPTNPTVQTEPPGSPNPADPGRKITFTLGDVSNSGATNGTVTIRYTAVVLDTIENQDGLSLNNNATLTWSSGSLTTSAPNVTIVEPDFELIKEADRTVALPGSIITFTLTFRHTNLSNVDAFDVVLTDVLPAGLTYVPGSLTIVSGPAGGVPDDSAAPTLRVTWPTFPLLTGGSRTEAVVRFQARLGNLSPGQKVKNTASLAWTSLPGNVSAPQSPYNNTSTERFYDPLSPVNVYGTQANLTITVPRLPATGFAPGVVTDIPPQPADKAYADLGDFWLEIPKLGVKMPIVGVPAKGEEWDLTWLWDQAGWLEGTAYPTHAGNSALTAHVYLPNGQPGPFLNLGELRWGDQVIVHLGAQKYIYEVRQVQQVSPYSLSPLRHEDLPWLTLITCREYDARTDSYRYRVIVRAVLIKVVE